MYIISILSALLRSDLHSELMSSYKIIEGSREGSQVYVCDLYVYVKDKDKNNSRYIKCAEFRKGCPGRASLNLETGELFVTKRIVNIK